MKSFFLLQILILLGGLPMLAQQNFESCFSLENYDGSLSDLSEQHKIEIERPSCAYVNISNIDKLPTKKNDNFRAWLECYDGNGHYFKKRVILNAQGNSSLYHPKQNISVDFFDDEWVGDSVPKITIGNWVSQDAFHLKAYYTDYLRGIGTIGYTIYDDMVSDHSHFLDRSNIRSEKARCYPAGFPCIVYLNGDFYGIFAWQLKKHRDNMAMKKNSATHIYLDGTIGDVTLWYGDILWNYFEVRNPKGLYCSSVTENTGYEYCELIDEEEINSIGSNYLECLEKPSDWSNEQIIELYGPNPPKFLYRVKKNKWYKLIKEEGLTYEAYNGDSPQELIDESMAYYNPSKVGHVLSATVKHSIEKLASYCGELKDYEQEGMDNESMRQEIAKRFDVTSMIDYMVFGCVFSNYDGFNKNWQWFTYDGEKWFVAPYDLDCTFGNFFKGTFAFPAEWTWYTADYQWMPQMGPCLFFSTYFFEDIKARYAQLRQEGIFDEERIMNYLYDWHEIVGKDNYSLEYQKWSESGCNRDLIVSDGWTTDDNWTNYSQLNPYSETTTYNEGDKCRLDYRIWTATKKVRGVKPYQQLGFHDNLSRYYYWLGQRLMLEDRVFSYTNTEQSEYQLEISQAGVSTLCVPFTFVIPQEFSVYTITGIKDNSLIIQKVLVPQPNMPYLVFGNSGSYTLRGGFVSIIDQGSPLTNGLLHGTYTPAYVPEGGYVLQVQNGSIAFYRVDAGHTMVVGRNHAWLEVPMPIVSPVQSIDITVIDEIEEIAVLTKDDPVQNIRDISGFEHTSLVPGINIVIDGNGRVKKIYCSSKN